MDPRNCGEPAWGLPRPASRAHPRGRERWRRAADRRQRPGELALWAKGARRRAPGWPPPPLGESARRACRAADAVSVLGSTPLCCAGCAQLRRWRCGGPTPAPAGRHLRQPIARPCRLPLGPSSFRRLALGGKETPGWGWGPLYLQARPGGLCPYAEGLGIPHPRRCAPPGFPVCTVAPNPAPSLPPSVPWWVWQPCLGLWRLQAKPGVPSVPP